MMIVLFHSTQGLRPLSATSRPRSATTAMTVLVPDLYDGRTASTLEDGLALKDAAGWTRIEDRARHALRDLPADTALAGVSMGAGVVSEVWRDRPATPAVVLIHGYAVIPDHVAAGVRASLHVAVGDRFAPADTIATWRTAAAAQGVDTEVHRYPDVGHFFTDPASADYDKAAVQTLSQRVRTFLRNAA